MYTENSRILAPTTTTPEQSVAYMLARECGYNAADVRVIVGGYYRLCTAVGVSADITIPQTIHETGNLTSAPSQRRYKAPDGTIGNCRNPAGIGVNGDSSSTKPTNLDGWLWDADRDLWRRGVGFATWLDDAIPAHIGRLLAYALKPGQATTTQKQLIDKALGYRTLPTRMRGSAQTIKQLGRVHNPSGQGWASPGTVYGAQIANIANAIARVNV